MQVQAHLVEDVTGGLHTVHMILRVSRKRFLQVMDIFSQPSLSALLEICQRRYLVVGGSNVCLTLEREPFKQLLVEGRWGVVLRVDVGEGNDVIVQCGVDKALVEMFC